MATEYELTLQDYLSMVRRRAAYLVSIFIVVLLISIIVAVALPPTYRASGTIMVESQQLSENIVPSAIKSQLDEQVNIIRQRVMTRENLIQIANKYNLFSSEIGSLNSTNLINKMRDRIVIETGNSNEPLRTSRQGQQAIAFTLAFEDRHAETALQVTNELITMFLEWNVKLRTEGAMETTAFLTQESDKLKIEVDRLEALIAEYKYKNRNALPEQLTLRMTLLARAENDLREVERDVRSTKEEIRTLEVELSAAKHGGAEDTPSQSLPAQKAELSRLLAIYKESHPDVKRLKRKIEAMENSSNTSTSANALPEVSSLPVFRIQAKIDSDKARLTSLAQQRESLQSKISENERAMIQTPKVGQDLDVLIRDRDSAQKKFDEFRNKKMNAKIAENLESENKSGRFRVLEPPLFPEKPFKPDRLKIIIFGFILALVAAGGVMILLETLDKRVRGVEAITHILGTRPLAILPFVANAADGLRKQRLLKLSLKIGFATLLFVLVVLHFTFMPMDALLVKIFARLG